MAADEKPEPNGAEAASPFTLAMDDPSAFLAAAFPTPEGEGSTLNPAPVSRDGVAREPSGTVETVDRNIEPSKRAAQTLAEVHSTARERGLLKESAEAAPPARTGQPDPDPDPDRAIEALVSPVAPAAPSAPAASPPPPVEPAGELEAELESGPPSERLHLVARWMKLAANARDVFLLDDRGYSLLAEGETDADGESSERASFQDLGVRLAAVLDVAGERSENGSARAEGEAVRVARLSVADQRTLAVMRVAPHNVLLGWVEDASEPVSDAQTAKASELLKAVLADDDPS